MMAFSLDDKVRDKKIEVESLKKRRSLYSSVQECISRGLSPVIGEVKRQSPSLGVIRECVLVEAAREMQSGGACCISVLTDCAFGGSIDDLKKVKEAVDLPVLRKDFIVDEYQIMQSYVYGADCILLIASVLGDETKNFVMKAKSLGMESLVEVHSPADIKYAVDSGSCFIGINNRNLKTMNVDLDTTRSLIGELPNNIMKVAESGIKTRRDLMDLSRLGADAFLVGTGIMKSNDIKSKVMELVGYVQD
ncbi:MAG: indole-3-glycerol phosphate synthase [Candidatus Altiarchaeales archaeon ex4484_96]|nr:MAG: indole-3-glycerol phosphate synthase [Candidatus Altiarchaeales archaeon ex4484_96]